MTEQLMIIAALVPAAALLYFVFRRDRLNREPFKALIKAFGWGCLSVPISLTISFPLQWLGLYPAEATNLFGAISISFFGAAIPEEIAKLVVLWLCLRKNKYFNEHMDGIVYAACVALGFAAVENIMYVVGNEESWIQVAFSRAIYAVPGHFLDGVLMAYFLSLAIFSPYKRKLHMALVLVAPIVAHGIYDSILFTMDTIENVWITGILTQLFYGFCFLLWFFGIRLMNKHLQRDRLRMEAEQAAAASSEVADEIVIAETASEPNVEFEQ